MSHEAYYNDTRLKLGVNGRTNEISSQPVLLEDYRHLVYIKLVTLFIPNVAL